MEVKRKTPFTPREKAFFFTLVKGYKIIENKKTNAAASHQKKLAWKEISRRYNAHPHVAVPRTADQLRKFWDNMKQRRRKIMSEQQRVIDPLGNVSANYTDQTEILIKNEEHLLEIPETVQEIPPLQPVADIITNEIKESVEDIRAKIMEDERVQQQELHDIRLEIAKEELRKMRAQARKAEAEEQLALHQLQYYKQVNRLI